MWQEWRRSRRCRCPKVSAGRKPGTAKRRNDRDGGARVDESPVVLLADDTYTPQQPDETNSLLDFFSSAQMVIAIVAAFVVTVLLVSQLWQDRRRGSKEADKAE